MMVSGAFICGSFDTAPMNVPSGDEPGHCPLEAEPLQVVLPLILEDLPDLGRSPAGAFTLLSDFHGGTSNR